MRYLTGRLSQYNPSFDGNHRGEKQKVDVLHLDVSAFKSTMDTSSYEFALRMVRDLLAFINPLPIVIISTAFPETFPSPLYFDRSLPKIIFVPLSHEGVNPYDELYCLYKRIGHEVLRRNHLRA